MSELVLASGALAALGVDEVERRCLALPQVKCEVIHRFGPGVYIREVTIPAGTFAVGHRQRFYHTNVMLKGRVTVIADDGTSTEMVAPLMFIGKPGRKVGYVHEDMVWLNVYATDETDAAKAEAQFIDKSEAWQANAEQAHTAETLMRQADRDDYAQLVADMGMTHEQVRAQVENVADQTPMPLGNWKTIVGRSAIHGMGMCATADIISGEIIAPARIMGYRTPAGRYTNHSVNPNAVMKSRPGGNIDLVALSNISGCHGGQHGEEITVDYRVSVVESAKYLEGN